MPELAVADIRLDGGTQQRPIDKSIVSRYQHMIGDGYIFPPIDIVYDGKDKWLWDGFHRYYAYVGMKKKYITAVVSEGTKRDAVWASCSANKAHGFPRQVGTVEKILMETLFPDAEWLKETDEGLAEQIGTTRKYVRKLRAKFLKVPEKTEGGDTTPAKLKPSKDCTGKSVPEHLRLVFSRSEELKKYIASQTKIIKAIKQAEIDNDELYIHCQVKQCIAAIGDVRRILRHTIPFAVCPYCGGDVNNEECTACMGHGFVNELKYLAITDEMKETN